MESKLEKYIILIAFITSFFSVFVLNGVIIAVPEIGREFAMNNVTQNWIATILVLTTTVFTLPAGQISGKFGSKRTLVAGYSIYLAGLILCCLSTSSEMFLITRIIQGIGISLSNVAEMSIVVLAISEEKRGNAIGTIVAGVYLGTSLSPVICGALIHNLGWRSIFIVSIIAIAFCIVMMFTKIDDEWITHPDARFDFAGAALYMLGIGLFSYGFTVILTLTGQILVLLGIIIIAAFAFYELRIRTPLFEVNLFKNKPFTSYNIAGMCGFVAAVIFVTIFNYYFQYVQGWDAQLTGIILIISPVVMSITAPLAGKTSDRIHPQKLASAGMAITFISLAILSFMNKDTPIYIIVIAMVLQAIGIGLFSSPNMNAIMSAVPKRYAPHASAAQNTVRAIGQTLGLGIITVIFSMIMGTLALSPQYAGMIAQSIAIICQICSIFCILAIVTSLVGMKYDKPAEN